MAGTSEKLLCAGNIEGWEPRLEVLSHGQPVEVPGKLSGVLNGFLDDFQWCPPKVGSEGLKVLIFDLDFGRVQAKSCDFVSDGFKILVVVGV